MSNRDRFASGFWLGTLIGGVMGGIIGATIASKSANRIEEEPDSGMLSRASGEKKPLKSRQLRTTDRMEIARRSLDDKISDLNNAIDAVRSSIGHVPEDAVSAPIDRAKGDMTTQQPADDSVSTVG
jgi:gas vesicle protein